MNVFYNPRLDILALQVTDVMLRIYIQGEDTKTYMVITDEWSKVGEL